MALKKTAASTLKNIYNKARQNYSSKISGSKSLLYNKYLLYVAFIISFMTLLGWLFSKEFIPIIVFILVGYLTTFFSKNTIVVLVIAFVVSNVVKAGSVAIEGMKEGSNNKKEGMDVKKEGVKNKKEGMDGKKNNSDAEEQEGMDEDEAKEGIDESPCTTNSDCKDGEVCDSNKFVCVAK